MYTPHILHREVAALQSVYHESNIALPAESRFSQQLLTKTEGHVTVKLEVSVQQPISDPILQQLHRNMPVSDETHIQVSRSWSVVSGQPLFWSVVIDLSLLVSHCCSAVVAQLGTCLFGQLAETFKHCCDNV